MRGRRSTSARPPRPRLAWTTRPSMLPRARADDRRHVHRSVVFEPAEGHGEAGAPSELAHGVRHQSRVVSKCGRCSHALPTSGGDASSPRFVASTLPPGSASRPGLFPPNGAVLHRTHEARRPHDGPSHRRRPHGRRRLHRGRGVRPVPGAEARRQRSFVFPLAVAFLVCTSLTCCCRRSPRISWLSRYRERSPSGCCSDSAVRHHVRDHHGLRRLPNRRLDPEPSSAPRARAG